jgi:gamma-glutamyltranspeptidase
VVRVEDGVPAAAISSLEASGLQIRTIPWPSEDVGHAQAIWASAGVLRAGSDPRADGAAQAGVRHRGADGSGARR